MTVRACEGVRESEHHCSTCYYLNKCVNANGNDRRLVGTCPWVANGICQGKGVGPLPREVIQRETKTRDE